MRLLKCLSIGLAAAGLAGCSGVASQPSATSPAVTLGPAAAIGTAAGAPPVSHVMQAGARAAAAQFYGLYSSSQYASAWSLLAPVAKSEVSEGVWISVHEACPGTSAGKSRVIKAVTAFGNAAIVTEAVTGATSDPGPAEDVFNYADGQWSYSPAEVGIYRHGSTSADVAAAKAAGLCTGSKVF